MNKKYFSILSAVLLSGTTLLAVDTLQIRSVNLQSKVVELHNFSASPQDLSGWRFCSHDENQARVYSSSSGLVGVSVPAGGSVFIHWDNDAPTGDSSRLNASTVGPVAQPLGPGPFGIQIYFPPVIFVNGATIGDHLQWSIDGVDNTSADERSDEAEAGGVWTDQSAWISTTADTLKIILTDTSGARLHGPANYALAEPPTSPAISQSVITPGNEIQFSWPAAEPVGAFEYLVESNPDLGNPDGWSDLTVTTQTSHTEAVEAGNKFFRVGIRLKP